MSKLDAVTSINGNRYRLGRELGRGGQGAVFAVEGDRVAVKLFRNRSAKARESLRDQLAMVGRLPLENLAIARPIEQLRSPHVGYVMELFTGMTSIQSLLRPPKGTKSVAEWYFQGGGLRRRLRLLARTAEVLSELHGRGLVYVDPSPNNVFVSEQSNACEVRLIDTDNLHPATAVGRSLYTPGYGAPEIVRQTGVPSSLSDSHAFAVIAFETLVLVHPLLGDLVREGEPEMEEQAFAGCLPWIDAADDDSNRSSDGIPRDIVLSPRLQADFSRTFGLGLSDPNKRPGLAQWAEHLHQAADRTVTCPACSGSYFYNRDACPWCDASRPGFVIAAVLLWDPQRLRRLRDSGGGELDIAPGIVREPSGKERVVDALVVSANQSVELTERLTHGTSGSTPKLRVEFTGDRLTLEPLDGEQWRLTSFDGQQEHLLKGLKALTIKDTTSRGQWMVHACSDERLHRVIRFDLRQERT